MNRVYTAICGSDYPIEQRADIKCFNGARLFDRPVLDAKRYKILPHLYLPDQDVTIWVDGNIWLLKDPQRFVDRYLAGYDMALFAHPARKTVWEEFATLRKDEGRFRIPYLQQQLKEQEAAYRAAGLPDDTPLHECNVLLRRNNEHVNRLMDAWWSEIIRWQWRDQVSWPYVRWRYGAGVRVNTITGPDVRKNPDFRYVRHH